MLLAQAGRRATAVAALTARHRHTLAPPAAVAPPASACHHPAQPSQPIPSLAACEHCTPASACPRQAQRCRCTPRHRGRSMWRCGRVGGGCGAGCREQGGQVARASRRKLTCSERAGGCETERGRCALHQRNASTAQGCDCTGPAGSMPARTRCRGAPPRCAAQRRCACRAACRAAGAPRSAGPGVADRGNARAVSPRTSVPAEPAAAWPETRSAQSLRAASWPARPAPARTSPVHGYRSTTSSTPPALRLVAKWVGLSSSCCGGVGSGCEGRAGWQSGWGCPPAVVGMWGRGARAGQGGKVGGAVLQLSVVWAMRADQVA